jgi:hypothetical protein
MEATLKGAVPFHARRSMAACSVGDKLVFFGGVGAAGTESILDVANDCWVFDPSTLMWQQVTQHNPWPSPRRCVGVAPTCTGMYLWGGSGLAGIQEGQVRYTFLNDWWQFDLFSGSWSLIRDSDDHRYSPIIGAAVIFPSPRYTPVFQAVAGGFFLFGGYTEDRLGKRKLNDAWIYDGETWKPVEMCGKTGYGYGAKWPGVRYGCMSAAVGGWVFIFGGFSDEGEHNDLWLFDAVGRCWELIVPESSGPEVPAARYCSAFAYNREKLFLFGGRSRRFPKLNFNDLWVFDLVQKKWECLNGNRTPHLYDESAPFPAYHAKTSAAVVDGSWYLWGGEGLSGHVSDFWRFSFDAYNWELLQAARQDDPVFW